MTAPLVEIVDTFKLRHGGRTYTVAVLETLAGPSAAVSEREVFVAHQGSRKANRELAKRLLRGLFGEVHS